MASGEITLITGSAGHLGDALVRTLRAAGRPTRGVDLVASPGTGRRLKPGMTIAIEPMLNGGSGEIRVLDDRWTVVTADGSLSAHIEHTVAITDGGVEVLAA